jgi:hypothetical protein
MFRRRAFVTSSQSFNASHSFATDSKVMAVSSPRVMRSSFRLWEGLIPCLTSPLAFVRSSLASASVKRRPRCRACASSAVSPGRTRTYSPITNSEHAFLGGPAVPELEAVAPGLDPIRLRFQIQPVSIGGACMACPWASLHGIEYRSASFRLRLKIVPGFFEWGFYTIPGIVPGWILDGGGSTWTNRHKKTPPS